MINNIVNSFRLELDYLEKHYEKVKNPEIRKYIQSKIKSIYEQLEDLIFFTYQNKED